MSHLSLKEMKLCKQILFSTFPPQPFIVFDFILGVVLGVLQADLELCDPCFLYPPASGYSVLLTHSTTRD